MAKKVFGWSPIRSLMKKSGAEIVARDAVDALNDYLEVLAKKITNRALNFCHHSKRKKITLADMKLAIGINGPP